MSLSCAAAQVCGELCPPDRRWNKLERYFKRNRHPDVHCLAGGALSSNVQERIRSCTFTPIYNRCKFGSSCLVSLPLTFLVEPGAATLIDHQLLARRKLESFSDAQCLSHAQSECRVAPRGLDVQAAMDPVRQANLSAYVPSSVGSEENLQVVLRVEVEASKL